MLAYGCMDFQCRPGHVGFETGRARSVWKICKLVLWCCDLLVIVMFLLRARSFPNLFREAESMRPPG
ncbi:hypothetical protein M758_UG016800 [Ceratodon purpureus]|nr:hypothetical protein M758_UG016800 [Ceratodon purpureus]